MRYENNIYYPPPEKIAARRLRLEKILFLSVLLPAVLLLTTCGGGSVPLAEAEAAKYTTTVSGKVTTPAGNAVTQYDTATRMPVPSGDDAKVWASTAPATKVAVAADGSYTLEVAGHSGTFTLNVDYPAARDYKASASQPVKTTAAAHTQNIVLNYGYRTTLSGSVIDSSGPAGPRNEVPVIIEVEGREVDRTVSSTIGGNAGSYRITFDHPGTFRATASFGGREGVYSLGHFTGTDATTGAIILR